MSQATDTRAVEGVEVRGIGRRRSIDIEAWVGTEEVEEENREGRDPTTIRMEKVEGGGRGVGAKGRRAQ